MRASSSRLSRLALFPLLALVGTYAPWTSLPRAHAAPAASPVEITDQRTRSSKTMRNADGTLTTVLSAGAMHYRDAAGRWQSIDSDVVETAGDPEYGYRNAANSFDVRFKRELGPDYLRFGAGGIGFALSLDGAGARPARAAGNGLAYADAVGGVDLRYDVLADGVKETLVLPDAKSRTRYRFTLRPLSSAPVRAERLRDGGWGFFVGAGMSPAFTVDRPVAVDSAPGRQVAAPDRPNATLDVVRTGPAFDLVLTLDADWLADPARVFPVLLDPTITIQPPVEDASFAYPCTNCLPYVSENVFVGTDANYAWRGTLQFNLAEIPTGADVTSAAIETYWGPLCMTHPSGFCGNVSHQVDLHRLTTGWTTSSTSDALGYDPAVVASDTVSPGEPAQWMTWPVTTTVRDWLAGATPNFGVVLKRSAEPTNVSGPVFYGRRHGEPSLQPRLVVTYPGDGVNLLPPDTLHSNGADLRWTPYPDTATTAFDRYEVHRSTSSSFTPSTTTLLTTIRDKAVTSFRDTTASPSRTFTYKVVANTVASSGRTVTLPASGQATKLLQPGAADGVTTSAVLSTTLTNCANYGNEATLWVGPGTETVSRGLLRFDVRDVPANASVTKAVMSVWAPYRVDTPNTVRAYAATAEWREGTGLSTCSNDGATWYDAYGGVKWTALGTDVEGTHVAEVSNAVGDLPAFDDFDVTALAKRWVDGTTPNHGVMLRHVDEVTGAGKLHNYHSDDFAVAPGLRPKLAVTYADGSVSHGPAVALANPGAGSTLSGTAVSLGASASDDHRVSKVEFLVDGVVVGTDTTEPYAVTWNSTTAVLGAHTITARATDSALNVTTSPAVSVNVDNSAPPTTSVTSPTGTLSDYRAQVVADTPIAYWRLGESVGPVATDAIAGRNGTYVGNPTPGVTGALGRDPDLGLQVYPGSYVSVPKNSVFDLNGSFTLEWWGAALGSQSAYPGFLRYGSSGTPGAGWLVFWDGVYNKVYFKRDGKQYPTSTSPLTSSFKHLAVSYDQALGTLRWYVDGALNATYTGVTFQAGLSAEDLRVGAGDHGSSGRLDEVAIYGAALTEERIKSHFGAGSAAPAVSGVVPVAATAGDDRGVTKVEFYADAVRFAEDTVAPYDASWNTLDPALPAFDGVHVLTTRAYDAAGQVTTSAGVPVRVANTGVTRFKAATGTTTPPQLVVGDPLQKHPVDVTVTNDSTATWTGTDTTVRYQWIAQDPATTTVTGTAAALGTSLAPGQNRTIRLDLAPPALPDGVQRAEYLLRVDLVDSASGSSFSSKGNKPKDNPVVVAKSLEDALGLERYYQYRGTPLGAGMSHLVNVANGNSMWRWTPWNAPGRGLSTVLDFTYNSLEKKWNSPVGTNVSMSISGLSRFGTPIDIHPNKADSIAGNANRYVVFTDGDGTSHRFNGAQAADGTVYWDAPPGVHLYLRSTADATCKWAFTRPDRVTFCYDDEGFPTRVEDNNSNRLTYTVERIPPGEDGGPVKKRVTAVTDAGGRSFRLDYYSKDEAKKQQIRGKVQRITDHTGSALDFFYYEDGNLLKIVQRGGTKADGSFLADRSFVFTYTVSNGEGPAIADPALRVDPEPKTPNQSSLVYSIRDPRGSETRFDYYGPGTAQLRDKLESVTDRAGAVTTYGYDLTNRVTTATAPLSRVTKYTYDTDGKATAITNPLNETTTLGWDADFKVIRLTEPTGAATTYDYNDNGYLSDVTDQVGNHTKLEYENVAVDANDVSGKWEAGRTIPHISQLKFKISPNAETTTTVLDDFRWEYRYDTRGNLVTILDPLRFTTTLVVNADGTVASETDARNNKRTYGPYDANGFPTRITDPLGRVTTFNYDADGLLRWVQDAAHQGATGTNLREYRSYMDYDSFHRMGRRSAPKSTTVARGTLIWSGADFDPNDNVLTDVHPHFGTQYAPSTAFRVQRVHDVMDRQTRVTELDTSADPAGERTETVYDLAGRMTRQTRPLGVQSTGIANDHVIEFAYDPLDRVVTQTRYEVDKAGTLRSTQRTRRCYDLAGDLVKMVPPKGDSATFSCGVTNAYESRYTYDAAHRMLTYVRAGGATQRMGYDRNSNITSRTNENNDTTTYAFDQRDKLVSTVQPFVVGTTPRSLTTKFEYDPVGNQTKVVSPRAYDHSSDKVTFATHVTKYVFDAANQMTRIDLPAAGTADQYYIHRAYDLIGNLATTTQSVPQALLADVPNDKRTDYAHWDPGWIRRDDDHVNPATHYDYDSHGRPTSRTPQQKTGSDLNLRERQTYSYYPDGLLRERGDAGGQKVVYTYDANDNRLTVKDSSGVTSSGQKTMEIVSTYDGLNRQTKTRQKKNDETRWKVTEFGFDLHDNTQWRIDAKEEDDPGNQLKAGRRHDFTHDVADFVTQQIDQGKDATPNTSDDQRIRHSVYPTEWEKQRIVERYDAGIWRVRTTTDWTYYANGLLKTLTTKNGSGVVIESHDVSYTDALNRYVNGNRTKDVFRRSSPSTGTPCSGTSCTATYEYNAQDRLTKQVSGAGTTTDFGLDPAGNVERETETSGGVSASRSFTYNGNQVNTATDATGTSKYNYDTRGNLECVTPGTTAAACATAGNAKEKYSYDYLDRLTGYTGGSDSASYEYDALDRQTKTTESHSGASRTTDLTYIGTTNAVAEEKSGTSSKAYSYDGFGNPVSMTDQSAQTSTYAFDPQGSVSMLVNDAGSAKASYGYKPYGDLETSASSGDTSKTNPVNPIRYMSKRFDSGSGTVDMGVRRFGPTSTRFLQEDRYAGALSNLDLSVDPLTQNRYSLAGGNPANFVEVDGHFSIRDLFGGSNRKGNKDDDKKSGIRGWFDKAKNKVTSAAKQTWNEAKEGVSTVGGAAFEAGQKVAGGAAEAIEGFPKQAGKMARKGVKGVADAVEDVGEEGAAKVSKFANKVGASKAAKSVAKWGDEFPDKAEDAIRSVNKHVTREGVETFGKWAGRAVDAVGAAKAGYDEFKEDKAQGDSTGRALLEGAAKGVANFAGSQLGSAGGAALGTMLCGPACGVAGGIVGGIAGEAAGNFVGNLITD